MMITASNPQFGRLLPDGRVCYTAYNPPVKRIAIEPSIAVLGLIDDEGGDLSDDHAYWDIVAYWPQRPANPWTQTRMSAGAGAYDTPVKVLLWVPLPAVPMALKQVA